MDKIKPAENHFVIGLTGNIGSGKSLVRKMLEHLGALGVDADWVTRQASQIGGPAYDSIVARFGKGILDNNGDINRKQLGLQVFSGRKALEDLEEILHPLASVATRRIITQSPLPVVVVEAIKVLESDLAGQCQSIWVVEADERSVYERLERTRGMSPTDARARLAQQTPAAQMKEKADVVINNSASIASAWEQVRAAWQALLLPTWDAAPFLALQQQVDLLPADKMGLKQVHTFLKGNPDSLPSRFLESQRLVDPKVNDQQDLLLRDMLRFCFSAAYENELAIWSRNGFACHLEGYQFSAEHSSEKLETLIKGIEALNAYYLCGKLSLPARSEDASMLARLGYDIHKNMEEHFNPALKAGYNSI